MQLRPRVISVCVLIQFVTGCASTVTDIAKQAAPAAAISTLQAVGDPQNQKVMTDVGDSPAVEHITTRLGYAVGQSLVDQSFADLGIGQPPGTTRPTTQGLPDGINGQTAGQLGQMTDKLSAQLTTIVQTQLRQIIATLFSSDTQKQAGDMAATVSEAVLRGMSRGLHDQLAPELNRTIREQVGPAIASTIHDQVGPAIEDAVRLHLAADLRNATAQAAMGIVDTVGQQSTKDAARGLTMAGSMGVHDALLSTGKPEPLEEMSRAIIRMTWIIIALLVIAGLQTTAIFIFLTMQNRARRQD